MRRLASFRKHVEGLELEKQAELLTCPNAAKLEIAKLLNENRTELSNENRTRQLNEDRASN